VGLWYLSFCDGDRPKGSQFLGACVVIADSPEGAVTESHLRGCNPGGEIAMWEAPAGTEREVLAAMESRGQKINTLLSRADIGEDALSLGELEEAIGEDAHPTDSVCAHCNPAKR
jgi:hypothetical protein